MKKIFCIFILFISSGNLFAKTEYIKEGIDLYNKNKFEDAKFKFEQDIVFNPKSELSYLYLSKIFNKKNNNELESEKLGAKFFGFVKSNEVYDIFIQGPDFFQSKKSNVNFDSFVHGAELKSYEFNLYKSINLEMKYVLL